MREREHFRNFSFASMVSFFLHRRTGLSHAVSFPYRGILELESSFNLLYSPFQQLKMRCFKTTLNDFLRAKCHQKYSGSFSNDLDANKSIVFSILLEVLLERERAVSVRTFLGRRGSFSDNSINKSQQQKQAQSRLVGHDTNHFELFSFRRSLHLAVHRKMPYDNPFIHILISVSSARADCINLH